MSLLTPAQYERLIAPIEPGRVSLEGGFDHVEQWDVRRWLIRIFGFGGFDITTLELAVVREIEHPSPNPGGKSRWSVIYRAQVRLTVKHAAGNQLAEYEDGAVGSSIGTQPDLADAHDQALKTALSQALKRCAVNLGDQFGLSLYANTKAPIVVRTCITPPTHTPEKPS